MTPTDASVRARGHAQIAPGRRATATTHGSAAPMCAIRPAARAYAATALTSVARCSHPHRHQCLRRRLAWVSVETAHGPLATATLRPSVVPTYATRPAARRRGRIAPTSAPAFFRPRRLPSHGSMCAMRSAVIANGPLAIATHRPSVGSTRATPRAVRTWPRVETAVTSAASSVHNRMRSRMGHPACSGAAWACGSRLSSHHSRRHRAHNFQFTISCVNVTHKSLSYTICVYFSSSPYSRVYTYCH